jgi:hypothetical protein
MPQSGRSCKQTPSDHLQTVSCVEAILKGLPDQTSSQQRFKPAGTIKTDPETGARLREAGPKEVLNFFEFLHLIHSINIFWAKLHC